VKTISLKKVSAVAVASLGFGLLSVVPANAADQQSASGTVSSINLKAATANTSTTGSAVTVFVGSTQVSESAPGASNNILLTYKAYLSSYPAGGYVAAVADKDTAGLTITGQSAQTESGSTLTIKGGTNAAITAETLTATGATGLGNFSFTPTVTGAYVMTVWNDQNADGIVNVTEAVQTVSLTITAAATLATTLSTAYMTEPSANGATASSTTNGIARSAYKTVNTGIAQIKVTLNKSDGTADTAANTVTATVTGTGFVSVDVTANTPGTPATRTASNSAGAQVRYVHINSDGTAGSGTVTVSVTGAVSGVTTTIGTFSYTSYDDVVALAVTTTNATIGKAGSTTGRSIAARTVAGNLLGVTDGTSTVPAFIIKATDSAGRAATAAAAPSVVSLTSPAVATGGTCTLDDGALPTTASSSTNGIGFYNCNFATFSGAKSGEKATLTIRIADPADATKYISTTFDVTVGGSISSEVLSFDKTAYASGEAMVITRTAKDSSGNPVFDGAAAPAVSFSKAVGGTAPAAGFYRLGASASSTSAATSSVFAPVSPGAFNAVATSSATGAPTITASASVTDANAGLLTQIDALNAKIVALNALIAKIMKKLGVK
jgi:hypothetical protein